MNTFSDVGYSTSFSFEDNKWILGINNDITAFMIEKDGIFGMAIPLSEWKDFVRKLIETFKCGEKVNYKGIMFSKTDHYLVLYNLIGNEVAIELRHFKKWLIKLIEFLEWRLHVESKKSILRTARSKRLSTTQVSN